MKYIRLKRKLEAKAREYQEVCFSERSFIASNFSKLNSQKVRDSR